MLESGRLLAKPTSARTSSRTSKATICSVCVSGGELYAARLREPHDLQALDQVPNGDLVRVRGNIGLVRILESTREFRIRAVAGTKQRQELARRQALIREDHFSTEFQSVVRAHKQNCPSSRPLRRVATVAKHFECLGCGRRFGTLRCCQQNRLKVEIPRSETYFW